LSSPATAAQQLSTPSCAAPAGSTPPVVAVPAAAAPAPVFASFFDYVTGNRSRVIQFAFIGFAVGVVILMTSTRKH